MAKIIETNPHVNTHAKRVAATADFVVKSSAIEGIKVKASNLAAVRALKAASEPKAK